MSRDRIDRIADELIRQKVFFTNGVTTAGKAALQRIIDKYGPRDVEAAVNRIEGSGRRYG